MITAIHDGTLQPVQKILSSRALAEKLDIARPEEILITLGTQKVFYLLPQLFAGPKRGLAANCLSIRMRDLFLN